MLMNALSTTFSGKLALSNRVGEIIVGLIIMYVLELASYLSQERYSRRRELRRENQKRNRKVEKYGNIKIEKFAKKKYKENIVFLKRVI